MTIDKLDKKSAAPAQLHTAQHVRSESARKPAIDLVDRPAILHQEAASLRDARDWRQAARRFRRANATPSRRAYLLLGAILRPARFALQMALAMRRHAGKVRGADGRSILSQAIDLIVFAARFSIDPTSYYKFKLHNQRRRKDAEQFICERDALTVLRALSEVPERALLDDKRRFADACRDLGLPHVETVAALAGGRVSEPAVEETQLGSVLPRCDLFVKRTSLLCGRGIELWKWNEREHAYRSDARTLAPGDCAAYLVRLSLEAPKGAVFDPRGHSAAVASPVIVQRRVENHPALAIYSASGALCTVRIVTARPSDGAPQFIAGVLRMPAAGSVVDNFAAGGVAAPIDEATGMLGVAQAKDPNRKSMSEHPDNDAPIAGEITPHWEAARDLALRAHAAFSRVATVGWDVAITPNGPVLLEANPVWCVELVQRTHGRPLGLTRLPELLLADDGCGDRYGRIGAAGWRRINRRLRWRSCRSAIARASIALRALIWPIQAAISCVVQARLSGRAARNHGAPCMARQVFQAWCHAMRYSVWPSGYYRYRLYLPERRALAGEFLCEAEGIELLQALSRSKERWILDDKRRFAEACNQFNLPHICALVCFENGERVDAPKNAKIDLPPDDLFLKSANLFSGAGVEHWKWSDDLQRYERDGARLTGEEILARLTERSRTGHDGNAGRVFLLQKRVRNHPAIAPYSPGGAVCTVRIVTARAKGKSPEFISAALRMPSRECQIDNFGAGGLAAPIDDVTGRLGPAMSLDACVIDAAVHPHSSAMIDGNFVPFWDECRQLCLAAHEKFPSVFSVGWDVAVTLDGPLLLEANPVWGIEVTQMPQGKPLGLTRLPELMGTWIGENRMTKCEVRMKSDVQMTNDESNSNDRMSK